MPRRLGASCQPDRAIPLSVQLEGHRRECHQVLPLPDDAHALLLGLLQRRSVRLLVQQLRPRHLPPRQLHRARRPPTGLERSHEPSIDSADFRFLFSYPSGAGIGEGDPEATEVRLERGVVPLNVHESLFFDATVYRRSKVRPK